MNILWQPVSHRAFPIPIPPPPPRLLPHASLGFRVTEVSFPVSTCPAQAMGHLGAARTGAQRFPCALRPPATPPGPAHSIAAYACCQLLECSVPAADSVRFWCSDSCRKLPLVGGVFPGMREGSFPHCWSPAAKSWAPFARRMEWTGSRSSSSLASICDKHCGED